VTFTQGRSRKTRRLRKSHHLLRPHFLIHQPLSRREQRTRSASVQLRNYASFHQLSFVLISRIGKPRPPPGTGRRSRCATQSPHSSPSLPTPNHYCAMTIGVCGRQWKWDKEAVDYVQEMGENPRSRITSAMMLNVPQKTVPSCFTLRTSADARSQPRQNPTHLRS
jgi:hypothetical protein